LHQMTIPVKFNSKYIGSQTSGEYQMGGKSKISINILLSRSFHYLLSIILTTVLILSASGGEMTFDKPILTDRTALPKLPHAFTMSQSRGIIMMKVLIDQAGIVTDVQIVKSSKWEILDEFVMEWIREWQYIPKISGGHAVPSFTILTVRFNLQDKVFEAPMPLDTSVQLPQSVIDIITKQTSKQNKLEGPVPQNALGMDFIPLEIQKLNLSGNTEFIVQVDIEGKVIKITGDETGGLAPIFVSFISDYLETTRWTFRSEGKSSYPVRIKIPISFNTVICKIKFGHPKVVSPE